jgi:hypothetical protein
VLAIIGSAADVTTIAGWSRLIGKSEPALHLMCNEVGQRAKHVLDFSRILRILLTAGATAEPTDLLSVADPRTVVAVTRRLLGSQPLNSLSPERFVRAQLLVRDDRILDRILRKLPGGEASAIAKIP